MKTIKLIILFTLFLYKSESQSVYAVPLSYTDYQLIFCTVYVNGIKVKALFDTGNFSEFRLSSSFVKKYGLLPEKNDTAGRTLNGKYNAMMKVKIDSIRIGGLLLGSRYFDCIDNYTESISKKINTEFDAVLGWPFFEKYFFELDISNNSFRFAENIFWQDNDSGFVPVKVVNKAPVIEAAIGENPCRLLFDCGAPFSKLDSGYYSKAGGGEENSFGFRGYAIAARRFPVKMNPEIFTVNFNITDVKHTKCDGIIGNNFSSNYRIFYHPKTRKIKFAERSSH